MSTPIDPVYTDTADNGDSIRAILNEYGPHVHSVKQIDIPIMDLLERDWFVEMVAGKEPMVKAVLRKLARALINASDYNRFVIRNMVDAGPYKTMHLFTELKDTDDPYLITFFYALLVESNKHHNKE